MMETRHGRGHGPPRRRRRTRGVRGRVLLAGGSVAVVIALVGTLIAVKLGQSPARSGPVPAAGPGTTAIDGAANVITAAICTLTRGQPGGVCRSAGVKAASGSR